MKKILLVFGTRPEAIKMCPLVNELKTRAGLSTVVCVTGQHREMLDQVLEAFHVVPDYDLAIMKKSQTLFDITVNILESIRGVLTQEKPDIVLVHGDTTTTFATSLACYYLQIPVGHVEAGLRTRNIYSPYPEEFNRQATGIIARYHFAPTKLAAENLISEGKDPDSIYITGNTVIDAMRHTVREDYTHPELDWVGDGKLIFITAHRRENYGEPMRQMFRAIKRVLQEHPACRAVYLSSRDDEYQEIQEYFDLYLQATKLLAGAYIVSGDTENAERVFQLSVDTLNGIDFRRLESIKLIHPKETDLICDFATEYLVTERQNLLEEARQPDCLMIEVSGEKLMEVIGYGNTEKVPE